MMKNFGLFAGLFGLLFTMQLLKTKQIENITSETTVEIFSYQDEFKTIETDEISDVVRHTVEEEYPSAGIAEAFMDPLGNYKLILVMDQDTKVVYLDTNGNWYSPEKQG